MSGHTQPLPLPIAHSDIRASIAQLGIGALATRRLFYLMVRRDIAAMRAARNSPVKIPRQDRTRLSAGAR